MTLTPDERKEMLLQLLLKTYIKNEKNLSPKLRNNYNAKNILDYDCAKRDIALMIIASEATEQAVYSKLEGMTDEEMLLSPVEAMKAWEDAFEKGIYLDHKPSPEEIIMLRMKAIAQTQLTKSSPVYNAKTQQAVEKAQRETANDFKIVWEFMNQEHNKGKDKEVIITAMGMIHDYIVGNFPDRKREHIPSPKPKW